MPVTFLPISFTAAANSRSRRPVMKTYAPSLTNSLRGGKANAAIATRNECDFSFELVHVFPPPLCLSKLSDCEDDPAERAALKQVTQSISRFGHSLVFVNTFVKCKEVRAKDVPVAMRCLESLKT